MPSRKSIYFLFFIAASFGLPGVPIARSEQADEENGGWSKVEVPRIWEQRSGNPYLRNREFSWYRCRIQVPAAWKERKIELFLEPIDDAREVFWNGARIATIGNFPPVYRSGLGEDTRYSIPNKSTRFGEANLLTIRVFMNDSRGGFNVAAPAVFGGSEAISLNGAWQARRGDDLKWAAMIGADLPAPFSEAKSALEIGGRLKRLAQDDGPLTPLGSLRKLRHTPDLDLDLVLSEPEIHQPLSIKFDERGRLWVVEYLQYPDPAGLTRLSHDMHLRAVYDRVPPAPPNHFPGDDRITIHEDTDGDGTFDSHKTFLEGLSLVSSAAIGRGGVWVLNPPYLLFYPDQNRDDLPDGDPEVHLEGFGLEDSHSIANSLRWGPDGWLYGAQGSTVTGNIRRPGRGEAGIRSMGQLIWRYHPERRKYEIFAEGGGNTFGVEIDSKGRVYSGHNGGNTRGFHYVLGGYYQKGFGKHGQLSNPNAFGYFNAMRHHEAPRFTHAFVIDEGGRLPEDYDGKLFGVEPLRGRVVYSEVSRDGSSYRTRDLGHVLTSEDSWFRPVDIQAGPDGAIYIADFYEQRIDHASHYQGRIHRESGRIYRLRAKGSQPLAGFDLSRRSTREVISLLDHPNKWFRQTALRILGDRKDPAAVPILRKAMREKSGQSALEALWALNLSGGFSETVALDGIAHSDPHVRAWSVRLACDDSVVSEPLAGRLAVMAREETDVQVRSRLASSARRLSAHAALPIVRNLLSHEEDAGDVHLPLLLWWAIESKADTDRTAVLNFARKSEVWESVIFQRHIAERLMRRFATGGTRKDLLDCVALLRLAGDGELAKRLIRGLEAAYSGRPMTGLPAELSEVISAAQGTALLPRLKRAEPAAIQEALHVVADEAEEGFQMIQILEVLGQLRVAEAVPVLLDFVRESRDDTARRAALASLSVHGDVEIGKAVLRVYGNLPPPVRDAAQVLFASRLSWTRDLLAAIDSGSIQPETVSGAVVRKLLLFGDPEVEAIVRSLWPRVDHAATETMAHEIERLTQITEASLGNPYKGKSLYGNLCGVCHVLFAEGGAIGPDLTSYQRNDLQGLLMNIVNPSAETREGYEQYVITTNDGRAVNGFLADQDSSIVILRGLDGQNSPITRSEMDSMKVVPTSLMPEGLLAPLTDEQIRDLFAYLRSSQPLPE